jgi:hypothetical protein
MALRVRRGYPERSVRPNRLILLVLVTAAAALATTVCMLQGATGLIHLALDAAPFLLVAAVLLAGRFPGEQRIIARRLAAPAARMRPARRSWPARREHALTSVVARVPRQLRGPPVRAAA